MRLFMIFIALVIALAAGVGFWLVNSQPEPTTSTIVATPAAPEQKQVEEVEIVIARQDIPVGKVIDVQDLDIQTWPKHLYVEGFIYSTDKELLTDRVARTNFKKGQPLVTSFLANKSDPGFLAAQLPSGMRAVTIPVDSISGISGFVFPGDRVDVIVKHEVRLDQDYKHTDDISDVAEGDVRQKPTSVQRLPREGKYKVPLLMNESKLSGRPKMAVTEVLIPNARVMAGGKISSQYEGADVTPTNVTLEVSEIQAEMIRHAESGTLTLALRSLEDAEHEGLPRPVADADMTSLTPPAYFPYLYGKGSYSTETLNLDEVDYESTDEDENLGDNKNEIVIIRGVEKETVGVDR